MRSLTLKSLPLFLLVGALAATVPIFVSCKPRDFNAAIKAKAGESKNHAGIATLKAFEKVLAIHKSVADESSKALEDLLGNAGNKGVTGERWVSKIVVNPSMVKPGAMAAADPREAARITFEKFGQMHPSEIQGPYDVRNRINRQVSTPDNSVAAETITSFYGRFPMGDGDSGRNLNLRKRKYQEVEYSGHTDTSDFVAFVGDGASVNLAGKSLGNALASQIYGMEFKSVGEKKPLGNGLEVVKEDKPRLAFMDWDHDAFYTASLQKELHSMLKGNHAKPKELASKLLKSAPSASQEDVAQAFAGALKKVAPSEAKIKLSFDLRLFLLNTKDLQDILKTTDISAAKNFERTVVLNALVANAFDNDFAKHFYNYSVTLPRDATDADFASAAKAINALLPQSKVAFLGAAESAAILFKANAEFVQTLLKQFNYDSFEEFYQMRYLRAGGQQIFTNGEMVQFTFDTQVRGLYPFGSTIDKVTGFKKREYRQFNSRLLGDVASAEVVTCEVKISNDLVQKRAMGTKLTLGEEEIFNFAASMRAATKMYKSGSGKNSKFNVAFADRMSTMFDKTGEDVYQIKEVFLDDKDLSEEVRKNLKAAFKGRKITGGTRGAVLMEFLDLTKFEGLFEDEAIYL